MCEYHKSFSVDLLVKFSTSTTVQTFLISPSPSVLTKSGPLGEWRRAKTEVRLTSDSFHFISLTGSEEKTITDFFFFFADSVFQDITSRNE